jgi:glycine hydroxymethyltransferase
VSTDRFARTAGYGVERLRAEDPLLYAMLAREQDRQERTLAMIAASSVADASVLACESSMASNVTTEGYPGARYHAGCDVVDGIEELAVRRATEVFGARYANVQPHSGTTANQAVMSSLLRPGDTILGMALPAGGHLTHGAPVSFSGRYFAAVGYGVGADGRIDYTEVERLARQHRPRLVICGASAYPRVIDFTRFRAIADSVGAYLLADISHIAGLVAAGLHPSPIDHAHVTTTSTYKQLYGPRGGLILIGRDHDAPAPDGRRTLAAHMQSAVFPYFQGTPRLNTIAAKARALARLDTPDFRLLAERVVADAAALAEALTGIGYTLLTGGTDNHMVLADVSRRGLTGRVAERALAVCDIIVNRNAIPGDRYGPQVTSGVRFGTNVLAARGMGEREMATCAALVDWVLGALRRESDRDYTLAETVRSAVRAEVADLCQRYPLPGAFAAPVAVAAVPAGLHER